MDRTGGAAPNPPWTRFRREAGRLVSLATPIMVALTATVLIGVVDTIMIAPLGTVPLAGASIAASVIIVFYASVYGLVSVIGVRVAQAFGARDDAAVGLTVKAGIVVGAGAGVLSTALMIAILPLLPYLGQPETVLAILAPYWIAMSFVLLPFSILYALKGLYDATELAWLGVAFSFIGVFLNVPANWLLIHGVGDWEGLGLLGAGLASALSETVSLIVAVAYWRLSPRMRAYRTGAPVRRAEIVKIVREGTPLALGYAGEGGAFSVAGLMLGLFGAHALAANQIVGSVSAVLYMVPLAMSTAVAIRVGQAIGQDETYRLRVIGLAAQSVVLVWMAVVMALLLLFGGDIARALSDEPAVVALATTMFVIFAAMQIADGAQATALGSLRGMMDNTWPVVVTLTCYWGIALPIAYVLALPLGGGPNAIWIGYGVGLVLAATILFGRFWRKTGAA
jgi:MATE family multidrug resistance protein